MQATRPFRGRRRLDARFLAALAIFALGFAAGRWAHAFSNALVQDEPDETEAAILLIAEALFHIELRYVDAVDVTVLADGAIKGMMDALDDPHSAYLRPGLCQASRNFSGEFTGIGVTAKTNAATRQIEVHSVIPNAPAEAAGVVPGDVFHEVDGASVAGISQAELSALTQGPRGTSVNIVFKRGDAFISFDIVRDAFELPNVEYDIIGDNIALISMQDFHNRSRAQLDEALAALDINTRQGLIFDLRNNPGGVLASAIEVGSAFIEDDVLLRKVARDGTEEVTHASGSYAGIEIPLVVLVDETSASASELIAGAMQDHGVAAIIGETTFGKGTVQTLPDLANGGCLRLTESRWLTPNGNWIHERGVTPDIMVEWNPDEDEGEDRQLEAAIDYLEKRRD